MEGECRFHALHRLKIETLAKEGIIEKKFKVKTTVYTTTVTLIGQTYDEFRKFAASRRTRHAPVIQRTPSLL